jgi:cell division protein ZapA
MSDTDRARSSVTVRIAGEEHTIRANVEPGYTRRCAQLVDERIREIRSRSGLLETHKAAILAALSITDELFQAREELEAAGREVAEQASRLAARIEERMGAYSSGE